MSTHFIWDGKRLKLHLASRNQDHQQLVNLVNQIYECNTKTADKNMLLEKLETFRKALQIHFDVEESYFSNQEPQDYDNHKKFHTRFINHLNQHTTNFRTNTKQTQIPDAFFAFVTLWLSADIKHLEINYYPEKKTFKSA